MFLSPTWSRYRVKASAVTGLKGASASSFGGVEDGGTANKSDPSNTSHSHDENLKGKNISFGSTQERSEVSSTREIGASDSTNEGTGKKLSAKSQLFAICVARKWKNPTFECWKEEGPPHMRMFAFKVIVEIDDESKTLLECFSSPHSKKKAAAEHAAEGALWYLKNVGYHLKDR
ncbi:hypothetical protein ACFX13_025872 [Malus domestica]|uniref:DRBM domain-containing protein n=1 Tax=Malus domestica TaxID=3750 RepID=A0A498HEY3_MALDO|nr:hypothetical protein DVH24_031197 [Malus domestica]